MSEKCEVPSCFKQSKVTHCEDGMCIRLCDLHHLGIHFNWNNSLKKEIIRVIKLNQENKKEKVIFT